jgi:hypothetical protein
LTNIPSADGERYNLIGGRVPALARQEFKYERLDKETTHFAIKARNEVELNKMLQNFKKKNPGFDVDGFKKLVDHKKEIMTEPLRFNLSIGGESAFKSICKTAINYYLIKDGKREIIEHLIPYIKNEDVIKVVNTYCCEDDLYKFENNLELFHIIHINGNSTEKILYAYVEFFSTFSFLILLNDNYNERYINETYCYDVLGNAVKDLEINLILTKKEILEIIENKDLYLEIITKKLRRLTACIEIRQYDFSLSDLVEKSVNDYFGSFSEGTIITEEIIEEFIKQFLGLLTPLISRTSKKNGLL